MQLISGFFNEYFIKPLCYYYNPVNTIVYGLLLCLAVLGTYKLLITLKVKINKRFFIAVLPFIIYGGWTRALRDHGLYQGWYFCSPPIYFVVFAIALASLVAGLFVEKKFKFGYEKIMLFVGLLLIFYNATITSITNFFAFYLILTLVLVWALIFFRFSKIYPKLLSFENAGIVVAHLLDASSSFVAIQFFGYYEQHPLPSFLIGALGAWVMFPLKIVVVLSALLLIDKYGKDKFFNKFIKIIILILGLALGVRDFLTVSMS